MDHVIQALINALHDPDGFVRQEAVRASAIIGPRARATILDLMRIAEDTKEDETVPSEGGGKIAF